MEKYSGFVYEWTNKQNGKRYIGSHLGKITDSYIGGGVAFRKDLKEFGLLNFERRILEYVVNPDDLPDAERAWLEKVDAKNNSLYYNKTNGSSVSKKKKMDKEREICPICKLSLVAVNYKDPSGVTHYRSACTNCLRKGKKLHLIPPSWYRAGYRKLGKCERCGFKARYPEQQLTVYHVDGNLKNTGQLNLKTVCLNCRVEIDHSRLPWREGQIKPDF